MTTDTTTPQLTDHPEEPENADEPRSVTTVLSTYRTCDAGTGATDFESFSDGGK